MTMIHLPGFISAGLGYSKTIFQQWLEKKCICRFFTIFFKEQTLILDWVVTYSAPSTDKQIRQRKSQISFGDSFERNQTSSKYLK